MGKRESKMAKRANFEITNEVSDFKGPECPFWDSRVPIWDSRVNLFEIFERQEEIWALNKGKKQMYILLFSIYGVFLCNLKKIGKMKKNFLHFENLFLHFAQQNQCWLAGFFFISQFFFFILQIFFFILQKVNKKRLFRSF